MNRTQKDLDIIRQSSLKSAAEIVGAFIASGREVADGVKWADWTIKVAGLFTDWVLKQRETVADAVQEANTEAKRKGRLSERTADRIREQVKETTEKSDFSTREAKYDKAIAASKQRQKRNGGNGKGGITPAQFAYLMKLNEENGSRYGPEDFEKLTAKDASEMIDDYLGKAPGENGNGGISPKQFRYLMHLNSENGDRYTAQFFKELSGKAASEMIDEFLSAPGPDDEDPDEPEMRF